MKIPTTIVYFFLVSLTYFSCGNKGRNGSDEAILSKGEGGRFYGGVFRINESEYIKNLFPHNITDAYSYRVASQVYEGLFKFDDETLGVKNGLVERYEVDASRTVYTFHLRQGVFFHDNPCFPGGKGREMTAEDVKYCFTRLCTKHLNNQNFSIFQGLLQGADAYYNASSNNQVPDFEVSGIQVIDTYTIQLSLTEPNSIFTVNLARPACFIYPREAEEMYGVDMRINAVGTGPFSLSNADVDEDISITLKKNPKYYAKD